MSQQKNRRGAERNEYTGAGDGAAAPAAVHSGGRSGHTGHFWRRGGQYLPPWFPLKSLEEARQLFERQYQPVYRAERGYQYAICLKEDDIPIGYVKVDLDESHDLGYGLRHEFWHRGIAAEAARALVEQVRRDGLPYLTATHDVNNPNSGAVMKKLGMVYQYSYEEQWHPKDIPVLFRLYQMDLDGNSGRPHLRYWERSRVHMVEQGI